MEYMELLNQCLNILIPALATLIAGWFAVLGARIKSSYEEKVNTQIKKDIVKSTVEYVQQVYKFADGETKLSKAIEQASLVLSEKGILVSEAELKMLIEAAVYGLKQGIIDVSVLEEPTNVSVEESK